MRIYQTFLSCLLFRQDSRYKVNVRSAYTLRENQGVNDIAEE